MNRFDRLYRLHHALKLARYPIAGRLLQEGLDHCSRVTLHRCIEEMRLYYGAPIVYVRKAGGYCYQQSDDNPWELPGLWFNASELQALIVMQEMLGRMETGILNQQLGPVRKPIDELLAKGSGRQNPEQIAELIRVIPIG